MYLKLDEKLSTKFPGLKARIKKITSVKIHSLEPSLETYKLHVIEETMKKWNIEELKDNPVFRSYRDFFWKVGVDPTKTRPAAEALIRRILRGNPPPMINTLVDAYNLASVSTCIPFGAFDLDKIDGELVMREAVAGEEFLGIGMDKPAQLSGGEAIIEDDRRLIAIYPYRDADYSRVGVDTLNVLLLTCGVPSITEETLTSAEHAAIENITRFCGGTVL